MTAKEVAARARKARAAIAARDQAIRKMRAEGATLRDIAAAAELSPQTIKNILDRSSNQ